MPTYTCAICQTEFSKRGRVPAKFCSLACRGEWQRQQKPVTRDWLYQKYVVEGLGAPEIAAMVNRNSKRVWEWLRDYGIPTRPRGADERQHFQAGHQTMAGRTLSAETREKIRKAQLASGRVPYLKDGVHHLKGKRGADTTNWKGGITPERQVVYSTPEWASAVTAVWERDGGKCQRCGLDYATVAEKRKSFHIHHIVSFHKSKELRCEPSNLVLLCKGCHRWTHSRANVERRFLE